MVDYSAAPHPMDGDEILTLYYVVSENLITDEEGDIIDNIFDYISPNQLFIFKRNKEDILMEGSDNKLIELRYFDDPEYRL